MKLDGILTCLEMSGESDATKTETGQAGAAGCFAQMLPALQTGNGHPTPPTHSSMNPPECLGKNTRYPKSWHWFVASKTPVDYSPHCIAKSVCRLVSSTDAFPWIDMSSSQTVEKGHHSAIS